MLDRQCFSGLVVDVMDEVEQVLERIGESGLKITPQRMEIIEILRDNTNHPSADEILHEVRKRFPSTSYSTVYSTLDTLHKLGEVRKLVIDEGVVRYYSDTAIHQHMVCRKCGLIVDVPEDYLANIQVPAEIRKNFDVEEYHIEFRGLCVKCRGPIGPRGKKRGPKRKRRASKPGNKSEKKGQWATHRGQTCTINGTEQR